MNNVQIKTISKSKHFQNHTFFNLINCQIETIFELNIFQIQTFFKSNHF
jgi:hypothetical protein